MHLFALPASLALLLLSANADTIVTTITESAPSAPTSTSYTNPSTFQSAMLTAHNFFRKEHNVSALTWNATSATYAANYAKKCIFEHSGGPTGENLAAGYPNATAAVDAWGLEGESYNYDSPGFSETTGHFTQVVWSNTTSLGCAAQACNTQDTPGWYVVCEYYPPGNIEGDNNQYFVDNVKRQVLGVASDTVESGITGGASVGRGERDVGWVLGVGVVAAGFLGGLV